MSSYIFDPTHQDPLSQTRGGGRIIEILKENLSDTVQFIETFEKVTKNDTLIIPFFKPFEKPLLTKHLAKKQLLLIYDVIPLKYPPHFPVGIKGKFNLWRNKQALKNYDQIITISQHSKKDITQYLKIPEEKIEVIYPTASDIFLKPISTNFDQLKPIATDYCIYVGDVNWNKNLVNLARAVKLADVPCVFVGSNFSLTQNGDNKIFEASQLSEPRHGAGRVDLARKFLLSGLKHPWQKEFRDFLTEIGDDKHFIFLDYRSDQELINLYKHSICNILISKDEGFGFSYLEAATLGCPSVLSDTDVFREVSHDQGGLFAQPDNPDEIADKIKQIFEDKQLRKKLSFEAQRRAKYFSREKFLYQIKKLLL